MMMMTNRQSLGTKFGGLLWRRYPSRRPPTRDPNLYVHLTAFVSRSKLDYADNHRLTMLGVPISTSVVR